MSKRPTLSELENLKRKMSHSYKGLKLKKSGRNRKVRGGKYLKSVEDGKGVYETPKDRMRKVRGGSYPDKYPFKNAITTQASLSGGAIGLAGGALKLAGQGANFRRLGKAEQQRVMMAILKRMHQVKQQGGLRIGALDLSMLPDIGSAISGVFQPKTALGRAIRKRVFAMIKARSFGDVLKGALTGEGAVGLAGGALRLAGQGAAFKRLGKAEQHRVMMSIMKMMHKIKKQHGGLRIGALDLSMLPDIGQAIKGALEPKSLAGKLIRKLVGKVFKDLMANIAAKRGRGAVGLAGGVGTKSGARKNRFLTKMGASRNPWILHKNAVFRKFKNSGKTFSEINKIASATYNKPAKRGRGRPKRKARRKPDYDMY